MPAACVDCPHYFRHSRRKNCCAEGIFDVLRVPPGSEIKPGEIIGKGTSKTGPDRLYEVARVEGGEAILHSIPYGNRAQRRRRKRELLKELRP